jgi:hypothetical protein
MQIVNRSSLHSVFDAENNSALLLAILSPT